MKRKILLSMLLVALTMGSAFGQATPWNIFMQPNASWLSGARGGQDIAWEWMKDIDSLVAAGSGGSLVDTGGKVWYVDNNAGLDSYDGLSWDHPKLTLAAAMLLSHTDIGVSPNFANRNRIYIKGDDFAFDMTTLARKTDIIGVGSDDGSKMPRILGQHPIESQSTNDYMGCRFINIFFKGNTGDTGALWTIPAGQNGLEFIGCRFRPVAGGQTIGILATSCMDLKIIGCQFERSELGNEGFTTAAISIATGDIYYLDIIGNTIEAEIGITINSGAVPTGGQISHNTIFAATLTIDDDTDLFYIANNTLISDAAFGGDSSHDFADTFAINNKIVGAGVSYMVAPDKILADLATSVGALSGMGWYGTIDAVGAVTLMTTADLEGFGDDFFNVDYVAVCIQADGADPEDEIRDITAYTSSGGVFTVAAWSAALEVGDEVFVGRREDFVIDGVSLITAPATGSLATFVAGTGSLGTPLGTGNSLVDALGTDGDDPNTIADVDSIMGAIGTNEAATNTPFPSNKVEADDDGSLFERLEALLVDITAILDDTSTAGVAIADSYITAAKMATASIGADEMATDAIDADVLATNTITADEIAADAIGASELAADAVVEIAAGVSLVINEGTLLESRRAGGQIYYVDNNLGSDSNTGFSWAQAFSTIATATAASHANIATSPNYADRNTIYIRGDDFAVDQTLLAQKTDIVGVGSDDSQKMPRIYAHWTIATGVEYYGTRFYNIMFEDDSGGGILFAIDNQDGIEFHDCFFYSSDASETDMLSFTECTNWVVDNCRFSAEGSGAAIKVEDDSGYANAIRITNNRIFCSNGIAIDWDETECINSWITDNYIVCTSAVRTIDCEAAHGVWVINNRLITGVDTDSTVGDGYDFNELQASGNLQTGSGGDCNWIPDIE